MGNGTPNAFHFTFTSTSKRFSLRQTSESFSNLIFRLKAQMCTPGDTTQCVIYANRYQQLKKLGQGSFGTVYVVHDMKSAPEKKVLKEMFVGKVSPNESLDAEHEASILARLRHPNIVKFYDSFVDGLHFCIVTEYCEDGDLDQCLKSLRKKHSRLESTQVIDLFVQLLSAISYLHSKKLLHRDIKTSNIFLKNNKIKLGDFGISRFMMYTLDKASTFIGTPFYMSPETLRYDGYDTKSDIWSAGCVLYELCVCKRAFERPNIVQTMDAILNAPSPLLPDRLPQRVQDLYLQMLSKNPEKRLPASELLKEFRQIEIKPNNSKTNSKTQPSTPDSSKESSPHPDFNRSTSNPPLINKHIQNALQIPSSPVHSASSMESLESCDNVSASDVQIEENQIDPFSSTAKQIKTGFCRSKARELIGEENFTRVYNHILDLRQRQANDPTITDDIILSGIQTLNFNSYACTLIDELALYDCLSDLLKDTTQKS